MRTLKYVCACLICFTLLQAVSVVSAETVKSESVEKKEIQIQKFTVMVRNSFGRDVVILQKQLRNLGIYDGFISGIFGPKTEESVKKIEATLKMKKTGIVTLDLLKKIEQLVKDLNQKKIKKQEDFSNVKPEMEMNPKISLPEVPVNDVCVDNSKKDTSCIFDFGTQKLSCDVFKEDNLVSLVDNPNKKKNLYINANDVEGVDSVIFNAEYISAPKDWSLNIGNSSENNGWGGSYTLNTENAEVQVFKNIISVFRDDEGYNFMNTVKKSETPRHVFSREIPSTFTKGSITIILKENILNIIVKDEKGSEVLNEAIQDDYILSMKSSLYASINRTISDESKSGSGAKNLSVTLLDQSGNIIGTYTNSCEPKFD